MKTLNDFLLEHIAIEYKKYDYNIFLEKYGVYSGCEELALYIDNEIAKLFNNYKNKSNIIKIYGNNLKNFNNIFFNELIITVYFNSKKTDANYNVSKKINIINEKIDKINLNIYIEKYKKKDIIDLIMHELVHAFNDYKLKQKNDSLYDKINTKFYDSISNFKTENNILELFKQSLYLLFSFEQNAFISQIKSEIIKTNKVSNNPSDILNILKTSAVYKTYSYIEVLINYMKNNENDSKKLLEYYNGISDTKLNTTNQLIKKIETQFNNINNKLYKTLPKICLDYLTTSNDTIKEVAKRNFIYFGKDE